MHLLCCLFSVGILITFLLLSVSQLVFSFCDKLFGLVVKDIEAMDASILKGEPASGKKQQKVLDYIHSTWLISKFIIKTNEVKSSHVKP